MSSNTLLIELLTEELPPKALDNLGKSLANSIVEQLAKLQLIENDNVNVYASPRRLAVQIPAVKASQADQQVTRKGPSVQAGMSDGKPSKALEGFARSCGVDIAQLKTINDGKQEVFAYEYTQQGLPLGELISDVLAQAVKKLPIPKVMRWGSSTHTFVRPVHGLVLMHGEDVLSGSVLGLTAQNWTLGHRFLSSGKIFFKHADDYAQTLKIEGKVIASFAERRQLIADDLARNAQHLNATVAADDDLLNEVTALVEWPVVLEAGFEAHFLSVPQECLILTMQQNQKYFPLLDNSGKLMNRFLLVSNLATNDPIHIIQGNERVLRARLADAEFFFIKDKKAKLDSRLPKLEKVVYHNKIGNQLERIERLVSISGELASKLVADVTLTQRAALLAKADLVTDMVGEFPELQGIMGRYYALNDGEDKAVADAIAEHYQPRFAGDQLPKTAIATAVALADKLEALVGIWGIGLIPTGDKDPYALRRAALGVIRMLMINKLDLKEALEVAYNSFKSGVLAENTVNEVFDFMQARLAILLHHDYDQDVVAAVLAKQSGILNNIVQKLIAVTEFKQLSESAALAAANKRVHNLLKKADNEFTAVKVDLLVEEAEKALFQSISSLEPQIQMALQTQDYSHALNQLAHIKPMVDHFFDHVMVMAEDQQLKQNRLNLLHTLSQQLNAVADIALLVE